jgi:propanol-preferring alcohol dehydrogenase
LPEAEAHPRRGGSAQDNVLQLSIFQTIVMGWNIVPSMVGTPSELAEVMAIHSAGRTTVVRETRPLREVNQAIEDVEAGRVEGRIVFDFRS